MPVDPGAIAATLVSYGRRFYQESGTLLGTLYTEDGSRFDWGSVQASLDAGHNLFIRPATADEMAVMEQRLAAILARDT